jgi:hypothetical protein
MGDGQLNITTWSHEDAGKEVQAEAWCQQCRHVIRRAGAETVATGAGRARTESRNGKAEKASSQRQAHSEKLGISMCGRFTRYYSWRQIWEMYNLFPSAPNLQSLGYNKFKFG